MIEERFNPHRTLLTLDFKKNVSKKVPEKVTKRTQMQIDTVFEYMEEGKWYKAGELENDIEVGNLVLKEAEATRSLTK